MINYKAIMDEIPQPLWDNWYITDRPDSGDVREFYRIEAKRGERTDISTLKVQYIVLDDDIQCDSQQREILLEQKRREAVNETAVMYKLKSCPYIVGYEDENIIPLKCIPGYVMLIRMECVMELPELMKKGGFPPTEENVLRLAVDIGKGINAAYKQGVYHRDIKPSNFFAAPDGTFKLGDFNISGSKESLRTISGTAGYIAPEIYTSRGNGAADYTNRADIYSFGICLYQLMNDFFFPFEEESSTEQAVARRMNGDPLPVPKNASPEFGRMILRACAFDPALRYGSMDEMLCELENFRARRNMTVSSPMTAPYTAPSGIPGAVMPQTVPVSAPVFVPVQGGQKTIVRRSSKLMPVLIILLIMSIIALIIVLLRPDENENERKKESDSGRASSEISKIEPYSTGDVNGDGIITGSDASMILNEYTRICSGQDGTFTREQFEAADIDGDGMITGTDASSVLQYYTEISGAGNKDVPSMDEWLRERN